MYFILLMLRSLQFLNAFVFISVPSGQVDVVVAISDYFELHEPNARGIRPNAEHIDLRD